MRPLRTLARRISSSCGSSTSTSSATARRSTPRSSAPVATTGASPTSRSRISTSTTSCRSSTCAISAFPTGSAISRTPTFRSCLPPMRRLSRAASLGAALHPGQRDVHLRAVLRRLRLVERAAAERPGLRHGAEAHREGERARHGVHPGGPARRHLRPKRVLRVFPRREPGRDQARGAHERAALPVARPELRPPRRFRHVRVPDGQRHDARGVPFLPRALVAAPPLPHGQRLLRDERAPGQAGRVYDRRRRRLRLRRDHPPVLRPLQAPRDAHRDEPDGGRRTATRRSTGSGSNGPTCSASATTACRSSASPGTR